MLLHRPQFLASLMLSLLLVLPCAAPAQDAQAELREYDALWLAAIGDLLAASSMPPAASGALVGQASFAQSNAALNEHVAQLLDTVPPTARVRQHLVLLPLLAEATAALQAIADAAAAGDASELDAARDWLTDACVHLRTEAAKP
jgi:hypothetical protein